MNKKNIELRMTKEGWTSLILLVMTAMIAMLLFNFYFSKKPSSLKSLPAPVSESFDSPQGRDSVGSISVLESTTSQIKEIERQQVQRGDEMLREIAEMNQY